MFKVPPGAVAVAREAMATRFEIVLHGDDSTGLRAAGEEALDEVQRIEARLSLYQPASEIARVNALAAREPVRVSPPVFRLLEQARRLHDETDGTFDITIGPLLRCWGLMGGAGQVPCPAELAAARACAGMERVQLDPEQCTVRFDRAGVMLDLGAIGKGHGVQVAANLLREAGVTSAFIHGGRSSSYAIGRPPGQPAWKVTLEVPGPLALGRPQAMTDVVGSRIEEPSRGLDVSAQLRPSGASAAARRTVIALKDESLSVSAVWGKSFQAGGKTYGHVIDPRNGTPVEGAMMAAVLLPSATEADAMSTALLVLGPGGQSQLHTRRPGMRSVMVHRQTGEVGMGLMGITEP